MSVDIRIVPELDFNDLEPIEISVPIMGKQYVLREASGGAAVRYRNSQIRGTKLGPDSKPVSIGDNIAMAEPELVSNCLYRTNKDGVLPKDKDGTPDAGYLVPISTVLAWPQRIQKALFDTIKEISDLEEKETEEVLQKRLKDTQDKLDALANGSSKDLDHPKGLPSATTDGSAWPAS